MKFNWIAAFSALFLAISFVAIVFAIIAFNEGNAVAAWIPLSIGAASLFVAAGLLLAN